MKKLLVIASILLSGCASVDQFVCYGAGTCDRNPKYASAGAGKYVSPTPQTIITNQGTYMVVRDQQSGAISSIISTSKGK